MPFPPLVSSVEDLYPYLAAYCIRLEICFDEIELGIINIPFFEISLSSNLNSAIKYFKSSNPETKMKSNLKVH